MAQSLSLTDGWSTWAPRPEISPKAYLDPIHARGGKASLALTGESNPGVFGGWERVVDGVQPEGWYRFQASYLAEGLDYPPRQVVARLDWTDGKGKRIGQPEYPWQSRPDGDWTGVFMTAKAPAKATAVKIQLLLVNAPRGSVFWNDIRWETAAAPAPRKVTVASVNLRPQSSADPVAEFLKLLDSSLTQQVDVVLLPEGITLVGTGKTYNDVAEAVPGRTTERLGEYARRKKAWVVAGLLERERQVVYNTAVLIDRDGRVAGRYRKVYLPREEYEGGITPGSDYPVFHTDFGDIGMMICWDVQYPDPARALALRGAEMILMPIWGGNETLAKARAIENHVFLAASGYDHPTYIMDPDGEMLSKAGVRGTIAVATIDLARQYRDPWLGDMSGRMRKELRLDTAIEPPGRR
jgi:predicted amidohydrolase